MAKSKNKQQQPGNRSPKTQPVVLQKQQKKPDVPVGKTRQSTPAPTPKTPTSDIKKHLLFIAGIAVIVWLFLSVCLQNKFTNWDDPGYVINNHLIKDLSGEGLHNIFSPEKGAVMGNYHPITILTYALEYSNARLDPWLYHLDSLLFHLLTTIAIYCLTFLLTKRYIAAAICALLFGLHPMHVESIAWIAGRKDVVYGLFFITSLIFYVLYIRTKKNTKWVWYGAGVVLFILSILSKPVAVSLPVTLFLIDYFEKRKIDLAFFLDKIPFLAVAIQAGIKSVHDQGQFKALNSMDVSFTFFERICLGCYAFCTYLSKAVLPIKLSCFYPYPEQKEYPAGSNHLELPHDYYWYSLIILPILFVIYLFIRSMFSNNFKQQTHHFSFDPKQKIAPTPFEILLENCRPLFFGLAFFVVNIALLLQFIPVGGAIVADRYSYIPYFGLLFIPAWYISSLVENAKRKQIGYIACGGIAVYSLVLGYMSHEKCTAWYDSMSLWRDEISEHPNTPNAYNNLGFDYFDMFNNSANPNDRQRYFDSSKYLLQRAIELQPKFETPYVTIGELARTVAASQYNEALNNYHVFDAAKNSYYKAQSLDPNDPNLYLGLAIVYSITHKFDSAAFCFKKALTLRPNFPECHSNYGNFLDMTGQFDSSAKEYGLAIQQDPDRYAPYLNRGRAYMNRLKRYNDALKDFTAAIEVSPENGEIYYARAYCYALMGNKTLAMQDLNKAKSLGFTAIDKNFEAALK